MQLNFTKMHGIGNDYIYVNCFEKCIEQPDRISQYVSNRHKGVGSDGLILISPSDIADCQMRIFNADGSEGNMCGNGIRCVAKYVYETGLVRKEQMQIETKSGIKQIILKVRDHIVEEVAVDMGMAKLKPATIPVIDAVAEDECKNHPLQIDNAVYYITCVSMGNPHAVIFTEDVKQVDLLQLGPKFENNPIFPERVNTEFVHVEDAHSIYMRVWERGSGETMACGTGACASVVAAVLNGYCSKEEEITVHLLGGDLKITYREDGRVIMRGTATRVFDGVIEINEEELKDAG